MMGPKMTPTRAVPLNGEQQYQDADCDRLHIGVQGRGADFQAFDCAEHRNRRCDQSVPVKQGCSEQPEGRDPEAVRAAVPAVQGERHQRHDPALSAVIRSHDE
jgi:hypothetical protein